MSSDALVAVNCRPEPYKSSAASDLPILTPETIPRSTSDDRYFSPSPRESATAEASIKQTLPPPNSVPEAFEQNTCPQKSPPHADTAPPRRHSSTSVPVGSVTDARHRSKVDKVDSKPRSGVLGVTSRAQSRLVALGRSTLRGIAPLSDHFSQGEAHLARAPVSPSDGSSQYKRSNPSSNSKSSSEASLTDDTKSSFGPFGGPPEGWQEKELHSYEDIEEYEKILARSPRMMHQTSSKLLRMTADDRPFTRVSGSTLLDVMQSLITFA
jgi:hypothetical protein